MRDVFWEAFADEIEKVAVTDRWLDQRLASGYLARSASPDVVPGAPTPAGNEVRGRTLQQMRRIKKSGRRLETLRRVLPREAGAWPYGPEDVFDSRKVDRVRQHQKNIRPSAGSRLSSAVRRLFTRGR